MVIAVNTIELETDTINFDVDFLVELMLYKAKQEPENTFFFIVNTPVEAELLPANCKVLLVKKRPTTLRGLLFFSTITLPTLLKKIQAQLVIHLVGYGCITTKLPQILFTNLALSPSSFLVKKSIQKANKILVGSKKVQNDLISKHKIANNKLQIINGAANLSFTPLNYIETSIVKDGNADGREYFLAVASKFSYNEFINLLKAFSAFKRWQKSSIKLLVIGHLADYKHQLNEKIDTYKYRDDVELLETVTIELEAKLFGAAYAILCLKTHSQFSLPILQAFQANVPVICFSDDMLLQNTFKEAALFLPNDNTSTVVLADNMKLLYRDENLRSKKIAEGQKIVESFTYQNSYEQLQNAIVHINA